MKLIRSTIIYCLMSCVVCCAVQAEDGAVVKGKIQPNPQQSQSWEGHQLQVSLPDIKTRLFEHVKLPPIPFPEDWAKRTPGERQKWFKEFEGSAKGKALIDERKTAIEAAREFDVKIEKNGDFVVYDVPPGVFGLQGTSDKMIEGTKYRFEVFGQIEVLDDVDEIALAPLQITVTPLLESGAKAPPLQVRTHDEKTTITGAQFKQKWLFLNFWMTGSPDIGYQKNIQSMLSKLKDPHGLKLLSVVVDEDRDGALQYIMDNDLKLGSYGFTGGFEHRSLFDYGVRTLPSYWLIAPDGTIAMTPSDFGAAFQGNQDLVDIVKLRLVGPTGEVPEK